MLGKNLTYFPYSFSYKISKLIYFEKKGLMKRWEFLNSSEEASKYNYVLEVFQINGRLPELYQI